MDSIAAVSGCVCGCVCIYLCIMDILNNRKRTYEWREIRARKDKLREENKLLRRINSELEKQNEILTNLLHS